MVRNFVTLFEFWRGPMFEGDNSVEKVNNVTVGVDTFNITEGPNNPLADIRPRSYFTLGINLNAKAGHY